jgi:hypothetical protein
VILRALFFQNNEELGKKGILGQAPRSFQLLRRQISGKLLKLKKWSGRQPCI